MNVFIGHHTACTFWRLASQDQIDHLAPSFAAPSSRTTLRPPEARLLTQGSIFLDWPLHLEVPPGQGPKNTPTVRFHASKAQLKGGYLKLQRDIFIATPENTFIQMAKYLSLTQLICFGNELCATYCHDPYGATGLGTRMPATTTASLQAAAQSLARFSGKAKALRALRYIVEGTASPMETAFAAIFSSPKKIGGCQFPVFESNVQIFIPPSFQHLTSKRFLKPDFYWPEQHVSVEYEGEQFHTGLQRITEDRQRANLLAVLGITHVGITKAHLQNARALEQLLEEISINLGIPWRSKSKSWESNKRAFRSEVFRWVLTDPKTWLEDQ